MLAAAYVGVTLAEAEQARARERERERDLVVRLLSDEYYEDVSYAAAQLECLSRHALPALFALLDDDRTVKLHNTMDLIYPGATTFYGHGLIVDYDIDRIPLRAGWLIENITSRDFGFRLGMFEFEEGLFLTVRKSRPRDVPMSEILSVRASQEAGDAQLVEAVRRAKDWWQEHGSDWNRLDGLLEALRSGSSWRQRKAFRWLRFGETRCDGLNEDSLESLVIPEVQRLSRSHDEGVRSQAELLLIDHGDERNRDKDWYFLNIKGRKCDRPCDPDRDTQP